MRTLQMRAECLEKADDGELSSCWRELRVFSAEGALEQAVKRKKSFVFHAQRKSPFCSCSGSASAATQDGRIGEGC